MSNQQAPRTWLLHPSQQIRFTSSSTLPPPALPPPLPSRSLSRSTTQVNSHSKLPQTQMDHGGGHMDMGPKCSMNMLWNTQIIDTCIIFRGWRISSNLVFAFSFLAIVAIAMLYECLRFLQGQYDVYVAERLRDVEAARPAAATPVDPFSPITDERTPLDGLDEALKEFKHPTVFIPLLQRTIRALMYGSTVFLSFFIMLIFMTYNAYLILAVIVGAVIGHFMFHRSMHTQTVLSLREQGKGMSCH